VIVTALSLTPVKGTRLRSVDHVRLEPDGVRENRRFYLIDEGDRLANGKRLGALTTILSDYDDAARRLSLRFPDGRVVEDAITLGDLVQTRFYSHRARGRIVGGPFSAALSEHVGESLRLVEAVEPGGAVDRGADGVASLISRASLARLAEVAEEPTVDPRRFRMLIEFDGVAAHAEDAWAGRRVEMPASTDAELPWLSVIVPARDEAAVIEALIADLGRQDHLAEDGAPRFDVTIVDDRSKDGLTGSVQ